MSECREKDVPLLMAFALSGYELLDYSQYKSMRFRTITETTEDSFIDRSYVSEPITGLSYTYTFSYDFASEYFIGTIMSPYTKNYYYNISKSSSVIAKFNSEKVNIINNLIS